MIYVRDTVCLTRIKFGSLAASYSELSLHAIIDTAVQHGTRDEKVNQKTRVSIDAPHSKLVAVRRIWPAGVYTRDQAARKHRPHSPTDRQRHLSLWARLFIHAKFMRVWW